MLFGAQATAQSSEARRAFLGDASRATRGGFLRSDDDRCGPRRARRDIHRSGARRRASHQRARLRSGRGRRPVVQMRLPSSPRAHARRAGGRWWYARRGARSEAWWRRGPRRWLAGFLSRGRSVLAVHGGERPSACLLEEEDRGVRAGEEAPPPPRAQSPATPEGCFGETAPQSSHKCAVKKKNCTTKTRPRRAFGKPPPPPRKPKGKPGRPSFEARGGGPPRPNKAQKHGAGFETKAVLVKEL